MIFWLPVIGIVNFFREIFDMLLSCIAEVFSSFSLKVILQTIELHSVFQFFRIAVYMGYKASV